MTDSLRTLLATPGIHRQIGCSSSTIGRWKMEQRRPAATWAASLIKLAPELADEIREWCTPVVPHKPALSGAMKLVAFRFPEEMIDAVDAALAPGEDRSAVVRAGVAREVALRRRRELAQRRRESARRDDLESRPDTRHHADDCRTEGTTIDYGCARCAAQH